MGYDLPTPKMPAGYSNTNFQIRTASNGFIVLMYSGHGEETFVFAEIENAFAFIKANMPGSK